MGLAWAHRSAGRFQEAELWAQKALAENPDVATTYRWGSRYAFDLGDRTRMVQATERMRRLHPEVSVSLLAASVSLLATADPCADTRWLDALGGAGLPP